MAETYQYGPRHDYAKPIDFKAEVSVFAYMPTFKGLVTYSNHNSAEYSVTQYGYKDGVYTDKNWLPKLDSLPERARLNGNITSSMEIFVFANNFPREKHTELVHSGLLENLATSLGKFSAEINATDPDSEHSNQLLIDDMFNTNEGSILFLRLGQKVIHEPDWSGQHITMIKRTDLYRLNVASGEVLKYVGDTSDYSLDNRENWATYAVAEPAKIELPAWNTLEVSKLQ